MTILFSRAELLSQWLTRRGYQPLRNDVSTDISTGTDLAAHMAREVADWVRYVYATAPPEMLPVTDGTALCRLVSAGATKGAACLVTPADAARVVAVRLSGWERAVTPSEPGYRSDAAAGNPFMQPDSTMPLAVMEPDGTLLLRPASENSTVDKLLYVPSAPADDNSSVELDPLLLTTMATFNPEGINLFQTKY